MPNLQPAYLELPQVLPSGPALRYHAATRRRSPCATAFAFALVLLAGERAHAADILRGGAPAGSRPGSNAPGTINAAAEQARINAKDALARTTRAIQSVKAMQEAARAAALKGPNNLGENPNFPGRTLPNVPDGLRRGGLQVADGVPKVLGKPGAGEDGKLWRGAALPNESRKDGRVNVTVLQTKPQAVLNWKTFNVGKNTSLTFNQDRGGADKSQWTAFNKINDPSGNPSQILGNIEAPGQVYIINPNGIMFGGSSQITLHGLVASSLPINDGLITRGLLNNPDVQFLFSALPMDAGAKGTPAFKPAGSNAPGGKYGDVEVRAGAQINSPTTGANVGGRVMLVGPNVKNEGAISTPDGQTILAAGLQVGIAAHPSEDARLRGLDVYVGAVKVPTPASPDDPPVAAPQGLAGSAVNTGIIEAPRANVTIAGRDVQQLGVIDSSTSVTLNGSITLAASYGAVGIVPVGAGDAFFTTTATGNVTLGPDSVSQILPEVGSDKTVVGTSLALRSRMTVEGRNIHLGSNSTVFAPSADVTLSAGEWLPLGQGNEFTYSAGQIYLDDGALVSAAGTADVFVPVTQNILSLELRGAELADSPLQRTGPLRGPTLNLDIRQRGIYNGSEWVGTPLGDARGFVGLIERNVGELTTDGGTVTMSAGSSVVIKATAKVDVSGGYVNYEGGMVKTSRVLTDGRIIDIANATPDRNYSGLYDGTFTRQSPKHGISETFAHPLALSGEHFEQGYIEGRNAGTLSITAPTMALDGEMIGTVVDGPRQRTASATAKLGALSLTFTKQDPAVINYHPYSPTPPAIVFGAGTQPEPGPFKLDALENPLALPEQRIARAILRPDLLGKFGTLTINNGDGSVTVPEDVKLKTPARGGLSIFAANIDIHGDVTAPSGSLKFTAYNFTPYQNHRFPDGAFSTPPADLTRGIFTLGAGSTLSTAGLIVDDRPLAPNPLSLPLALDGGSIGIAGFNVSLAEGSKVDASGGVALGKDGKRTYGAGGAISILAGNDPLTPQIIGGALDLGAKLSAFSGGKGGSLTVQAPSVQIGGTAMSKNTLLLDPAFFNEGGFTNFTLIGLGERIPRSGGEFLPGIAVAPDTQIQPKAKSWIAAPYSAEDGGPALVSALLPLGVRSPVSLTLRASGVRDAFNNNSLVLRGDTVIGAGASIQTDPLASVSIAGETVTILGSIVAPGGSISVSGSGNLGVAFSDPSASLTSVHLASSSVLSTAGTFLPTPNPFGKRTGSILPGGRISITGNIVAESGALLDVSGTTGILALVPDLVAPNPEFIAASVIPPNSGVNTGLYTRATVPTVIDSDGGEIILTGGQHLFSDATLRGAAGGPTALGGSLTVSSRRFYAPDAPVSTPLDVTLQVTQKGATIPDGNVISVGRAVRSAKGAFLDGFGRFTANAFAAGGFDSLTLRGTVEFAGSVEISARRTLTVADQGVIFANDNVTLRAPYITLGTPFLPPQQAEQVRPPFVDGRGESFFFKPTFGPGSLTVIGDLIDVGNLSLQNIGRARFIAEGGDIRGNGTLDVAGHITLRAAQIYPPTGVEFTISASDYVIGEDTLPGRVTIQGSGVRSLPLSAGGQLNVYGSIIEQGGYLRAPLGGINIGWNGTGDAPLGAITNEAMAVSERINLLPGSITSVSAINPVEGAPLLVPFGLNVNGVTWIDPSGQDITAGGLTQKAINISGVNVNSMEGSRIDIRGGGDLFAYRWVPGVGGTKDILAAPDSFAILPGYTTNFAPFAPFNPAPLTPGLDGAPGYVNSALRVGDCIHLSAVDGLPEGNYTLLPARYALLPGARLVTLKSGTPIGTLAMPDGSMLVPGYRFNDLNSERTMAPRYSWFEVLSPEVIRSRSEYATYLGNDFLLNGAAAVEAPVPRLATDAGHLTLQAINSMTLRGSVQAGAPERSRGGLVDIASPADIVITGAGGGNIPGKLALDSAQLSAFGAESLLIGGIRTVGAGGTATVSVKTNNLTVDNAGSVLKGPEIILVANKALSLADGARIAQEGRLLSGASRLILGSTDVPGSGDGTLLRVTADRAAQITRNGITGASDASMIVGANVVVSGVNVTLDSTFGTSLDPSARLDADVIALNSGQISVQLDNPGLLNPTSGLVLGGDALRSLSSSDSVALLSYSTIDIYGNGAFSVAGSLALRAGAIRGFNTGGDIATISARTLTLDNPINAAAPASGATSGTLELKADVFSIGKNNVAIQNFDTVSITATGGVLARSAGGLSVQKDLIIATPVVTAARSATQSIEAGGFIRLDAAGAARVNGGLGASLSIKGSTVTALSDLSLPSGSLSIRATAGDVALQGRVNVSGTEQTFYDLVRYTGGGSVELISDQGDVTIGADSTINVSAPGGGGDSGSLRISARNGAFTNAGDFVGRAGARGLSGSFALDAASASGFAQLQTELADGGFSESQAFRVRTGDVTISGTVTAHRFALSADQGSIFVTGTIDASGVRGGNISLAAQRGLTLAAGSLLTVEAEQFDAAGKGGSVSLETRGVAGGIVDIQAGSTVNLGVAENTPTSAAFGQFTGTLSLRASQNVAANEVAVGTIAGNVTGASSISVEGYRIFDLTASGGAITTTVQNSVLANGNAFLGANGTTTAAYTAMHDRILGTNTSLASVLTIRAGAELINSTGSLTLGASGTTSTSDWSLASYRFGPKRAPGVLTMRAAQDLVFFNTLSDGFQSSAYNSLLLAQNTALPVNAQSWSYRLIAGADLTAADVSRVRAVSELAAGKGSVLLGKNGGSGVFVTPGPNALTAAAVGNRFQVIRTGSGDITISAGRDVQLLNQFATIYTAGTQVADATALPNGGAFDVPILIASGGTANLGAVQQSPGYAAQYTLGGGNVTITAGADIAHYTRNAANELIADSSRQMPTNWLYRRGFIDPVTGDFGVGRFGEIASMSWWVDFSNFFEGVGALGGGNVTLTAGRNVSNVDAVTPTNARMAKGAPDATALVELGGGDVVVRAGNDIDGGVYYVERGHGTLAAGGDITTNSTRSPSLTILRNPSDVSPEQTWLPTTLFLGKSQFDLSARGDLLLGPAANPFLMPGGYNNTFWYKTYFSTYSAEAGITASSLSGDVTLRTSATLPTTGVSNAAPLLLAWYQKELLLTTSPDTAAYFQPWLRLNESSVVPFATVASLMPGSLDVSAFSGDVNVVGTINLSPSASGNLTLAAAGSVNGLNINGVTTINGEPTNAWGFGTVNLSDANPQNVPGMTTPFAYQTIAGTTTGASRTGDLLLASVDALFAESGSTRSVLQTKQALHSPGLLHKNDADPVRIYAGSGDIQGLTVFSPKKAQIFAANDITDIAFYIQNLAEEDISIVSAGRDIVAYNANSPERVTAQSPGNALNFNSTPLAGDLQIAGPGTLEVLAGRNLDLGTGKNNPDGTGLGILSIGNARNPFLPFAGADLVVGAGLGPATGLGSAQFDFAGFADSLLSGPLAERYADDIAALIGGAGGATDLDALDAEARNLVALQVFYLVLRDAGRDRNDPASPNFGNYDGGFAAIETIFPGTDWEGDISLTSREIKTQSGGDISIIAPGGKILVGFDAGADQALDQGILTESGGNIHIFAHRDVSLGTSRIFTLRGGNEIIWSSQGDIAAGTSSKTVQSAPPTRVLIDPQSADLKTDLAGLATGGGIGVLATVADVEPGDVDLIAPNGAIDAGDAGIRSAGNLNVAATTVLNAENIQVSGATAGAAPSAPPAPPAPPAAPPPPPANTANNSPAAEAREKQEKESRPVTNEEPPSIITVEVLGYGGSQE